SRALWPTRAWRPPACRRACRARCAVRASPRAPPARRCAPPRAGLATAAEWGARERARSARRRRAWSRRALVGGGCTPPRPPQGCAHRSSRVVEAPPQRALGDREHARDLDARQLLEVAQDERDLLVARQVAQCPRDALEQQPALHLIVDFDRRCG